MADNVAITAGSGTVVGADEVVDGTLGTVKVQYVKIMDGTLDGTVKAAVGAGGLKVDPSGVTSPVSIATAPVLVAGAALIGKVDVQITGTAPDLGSGTGGTKTQRVIVDSGQLASVQTTSQAMAAGFQLVGLPTNQTWPKGLSNLAFSVTFATLTRPANTTAYSAADSISDNATAGSVTALVSGNISDTNNDPIFINDIVVNSTDTGLAGKKIRAYLFNSDPTASSGVGAGDNAAYLQKKAGYIGSYMGWMETGFSDGTVGRLVPCFNETNFTQAGGFITAVPVSGARTLYIQYQAVEAFTPSANSTTIIGTARGWQGRAA